MTVIYPHHTYVFIHLNIFICARGSWCDSVHLSIKRHAVFDFCEVLVHSCILLIVFNDILDDDVYRFYD